MLDGALLAIDGQPLSGPSQVVAAPFRPSPVGLTRLAQSRPRYPRRPRGPLGGAVHGTAGGQPLPRQDPGSRRTGRRHPVLDAACPVEPGDPFEPADPAEEVPAVPDCLVPQHPDQRRPSSSVHGLGEARVSGVLQGLEQPPWHLLPLPAQKFIGRVNRPPRRPLLTTLVLHGSVRCAPLAITASSSTDVALTAARIGPQMR